MTQLLAEPKASPCGPRCGLECVRIQSGMHRVSATDEWRGCGGKENHRSRARDGYTHLTYAMYQAWLRSTLY